MHTTHHRKMPDQHSVTEIRASNIVAGLRLATTLVEELNDALGTSSLQAILHTTLSLVVALQVRNQVTRSTQITWGFRT